MALEKKNFFQLQDLVYHERRKEMNEKKIQKKRNFIVGTGGENDEERKEGKEGTLTSQMNVIHGLCAICHLSFDNASPNLAQNTPCSNGHALCHRCMQHFTVQSDPDCVLCRTQFQQSNTCFSRESSASLNSIYINSKRTQVFPQKQQYHRNNHQYHHQSVPSDTEKTYVKPWIQNCTTVISAEEDEIGNYDLNDSNIDSYCGRIRIQNGAQEGNAGRECRENRHQSYCNLLKVENPDPYVNTDGKLNGQISLECSRRPIRCPRIDCAINVAFSALTHHFLFDHSEVPILTVDPGTKSTLIVSFSALSSGSSRCLALLLVSGKLSEPVARLFNGNQINPKYRNRLPLPVLAARLHCKNRYVSPDEISNNEEDYGKDIIIAWVAGLDIGSTTERLRCSIQAMDNIENQALRSLTYTGPVNSLRTAQRPRDVFSTGDCIVLHEGLLSNITSDCTNLNVNVIVH